MGPSDRGSQDATLVRRAREGDGRAFEMLVRRHYRAAYAVARARVESPMDAEDVVQDAFIRALERIDDCDPDRFAGWFLTVVRNRAHNLRVYEGRRRGVDPEASQISRKRGSDGGTSRHLARSELRRALEDALSGLSPIRREVLLLHDLEGMKHAEIAEAVGISVGMSRYHLMQARRSMRRELDRDALEVHDHGS